jgi:hypothetical protein
MANKTRKPNLTAAIDVGSQASHPASHPAASHALLTPCPTLLEIDLTSARDRSHAPASFLSKKKDPHFLHLLSIRGRARVRIDLRKMR